ncbi:MAG: hypothetical protein R3204_17120 [Oceanospirillum sp.]|nr:hypothetical protein [Oceanospirillum sp.]
MTDFEQRSLELFEKYRHMVIERHRRSFREWFLPFYEERQLEIPID